MQRLTVIVWILLILGVGLLTGCQAEKPAPTETIDLELDSPESEPVSASGEVSPAQWAQLSFKTSGTIESFLVEEGTQVAAEQELARLEETPFDNAIAQANAALKRAEAVLEDLKNQPRPDAISAAEAAVSNAEANLDRLERSNAREIETEAAQAQIDSAKAALAELIKGASESQIRSANADIDAAKLNAEQAQLNKSQTKLTAPFDGEILEIYPREGDTTVAGTPVLLLFDPASLQVETTDLSELDVAQIEIGDTAQVTFDALPDLELTGKVVNIAKRATPGANITFKAVIQLDRIPDELRWGMTAFVTIQK